TITPSTSGNITIDPGQSGSVLIKNKNGDNSFSIDAAGNAQFGLDLNVLGKMEVGGDLTINGDSLFGGNATFAKMAQFLGDTTFNGDISANGRVTFNNDAGGIAIIKDGATRVDVKFNKEYANQPIITTSLVADQVRLSDGTIENPQLKEQRLFDAGYNYLVSNVTTKGFTIVLSKKATEDIQFNWSAVAISNANTFTSGQTQSSNSSSSSAASATDTTSQPTTSGP
ncbi:MAG TPA: hypothetical protein VLG27_01915, partial [Candidatus Saccharimonadia bacterium]|nr:hypothetical protein [Candidatus Saccharimonadia bacterium]